MTLPFVLIAAIAVKRNSELTKERFIHISSDIADGVTFHNDIIIVKENSEIRFLSSKCTHLGCQINSIENNKLICPCHGSSFALNGDNIKGPANEALKVLGYSVDRGDYIVRLG
ncbi:MAG: hypothetical protein DRJ05_09560 [Bacteroidetes bacterium]|nr:MAG: hypothetical protein DRJ05_09560 [Bacteroidota bacterium]